MVSIIVSHVQHLDQPYDLFQQKLELILVIHCYYFFKDFMLEKFYVGLFYFFAKIGKGNRELV